MSRSSLWHPIDTSTPTPPPRPSPSFLPVSGARFVSSAPTLLSKPRRATTLILSQRFTSRRTSCRAAHRAHNPTLTRARPPHTSPPVGVSASAHAGKGSIHVLSDSHGSLATRDRGPRDRVRETSSVTSVGLSRQRAHESRANRRANAWRRGASGAGDAESDESEDEPARDAEAARSSSHFSLNTGSRVCAHARLTPAARRRSPAPRNTNGRVETNRQRRDDGDATGYVRGIDTSKREGKEEGKTWP